jgi:hypothetical protein
MKFRALALGLFVCALAAGQTIQLMPIPKQQFFDASGYPLAGGFLYTYGAGTTTPAASYTDSTGGYANPNPVVLDAGGFASVWLNGTIKYKIVLQNSSHVQIYSVDNISSTGGGYVAAVTPGGASSNVQYNSAGAFAGDSTFTFSASTKKLSVDGSCITGQGVVYAACYGVTATSADNSAALIAAFNAAYNLASPGQGTPLLVQLPGGTLKFNSQISIPHLVQLRGTGRGDPASLVAPNGNATTLQVGASWTGGTTLPTNSLVIMGGSGPTSAEYFHVKLSDVALDGRNLAGGIFVANCQEQCSVDHVIMTNLAYFGLADWGANNNGNSGAVNAPFGLPANYQGSANDGPFTNIEIYPYSGASTSFEPLWLMNVAGSRGVDGLTIAADTPAQNSGVNTPATCGAIWGDNIRLANMHCEGPRTGWMIGPTGLGNGASNVIAYNNQWATDGITNGCTFDLQVPKGFTGIATEVGSGEGHRICNEAQSDSDDSSFYQFDIRQSNNDHLELSLFNGLNIDSPVTTSSTVKGHIVQGDSAIVESTGPCFTLQFVESTPYFFPYQSVCANSNGDLIHGIVGEPTGQPQPLGDEYWQGTGTHALGVGVNKAGLNFSAPADASNDVMALVGNNLAYNAQTSNFGVSNNGHSDADGLVLGLDGIRVVGNNSVTTGTYSPATVAGWNVAWLKNDGTSQLGNSGVSGAVTTITGSGGVCSLTPPASWSCTSDERKKRDINYSSGAMANALDSLLRLRPAAFNMRTDSASALARFGFIAQDVQRVLPGLVSTAPDGTLSLDTGGMVPYLVAAVQQLQAQVDALKTQLAH